jgi:hypothetical protein
MGQCSSTLPTTTTTTTHHGGGGNGSSTGVGVSDTTPTTNGTTASSHHHYDMRERDILVDPVQHLNHKKGSHRHHHNATSDYNMLTPTNVVDPMKSRKMMMNSSSKGSNSRAMAHPEAASPQSRDPSHQYNHHPTSAMMDVDQRDEPSSSMNHTAATQFLQPPRFPLPENAIRTRCYKLNLDAEPLNGISSGSNGSSSSNINASSKQLFLGPFTETMPNLTFSQDTIDDDDEDDEDDDKNNASSKNNRDVAVAIQTAQIFRGITVSKDGTILSQNARATRSNRGAAGGGTASGKVKVSEKSRQAAKIDKANDLIEQETAGNTAAAMDTKLVSLVVIGEYDDMKYLVRDGSRKLREADGLPDDALYSVNRPRVSRSSTTRVITPIQPHQQQANNNISMFMSSNGTRSNAAPSSSTVVSSSSSRRRRASSTQTPSGGAPTTDAHSQKGMPLQTVSSQQQQSQPQLPKLKSNPRDTQASSSQRRNKDNGGGSMSGLRGMRLDSCHDFIDVHSRTNHNRGTNTNNNSNAANTVLSGFGNDTDDWTHAWNLWSCGGGNGGTISPLQPSSPSSNKNATSSMTGMFLTQQQPSLLQQPEQPESRNDANYTPQNSSAPYTSSRRVG